MVKEKEKETKDDLLTCWPTPQVKSAKLRIVSNLPFRTTSAAARDVPRLVDQPSLVPPQVDLYSSPIGAPAPMLGAGLPFSRYKNSARSDVLLMFLAEKVNEMTWNTVLSGTTVVAHSSHTTPKCDNM